MSNSEVIAALERYIRESALSDRQIAVELGLPRLLLCDLLAHKSSPRPTITARVAGFLRRVGYI